jgi:serpin B
MPLAFTRFQADFSGINGYEPPDEESLFLSAVFHKAFVEVHEEGTEAAAATAAVVTRDGAALWPTKPPPVPIFRADHPFVFAIRDRKSGAILFLGRMADPSREG